MKRVLLFAAAAVLTAACARDGETMNVSFEYEEALDRVYVWDTSDLVGDGKMVVEWSSDDDLEFRKSTTDRKYYFKLPDTDMGGDANVTLTIRSGKSSGSATRTVPVPTMDVQRTYGLGYRMTEELSNDVAYAWYVDQNETGAYSGVNCGPAVTEMAGKWAMESFAQTAEAMRTASGLTGNWTTGNINSFLNDNGVPRRTVDFNALEDLKPHLDAGDIAILCLDIYYVRTEASSGLSEWRKDKFYTTSSSSGHFVIVKGYKKVDGEYLLEVYDPWSIGRTYLNGQYKGQDRYYRLSDILLASNTWWRYAIIVSPAGDGARMPATDGVEPDNVPEQWG